MHWTIVFIAQSPLVGVDSFVMVDLIPFCLPERAVIIAAGYLEFLHVVLHILLLIVIGLPIFPILLVQIDQLGPFQVLELVHVATMRGGLRLIYITLNSYL